MLHKNMILEKIEALVLLGQYRLNPTVKETVTFPWVKHSCVVSKTLAATPGLLSFLQLYYPGCSSLNWHGVSYASGQCRSFSTSNHPLLLPWLTPTLCLGLTPLLPHLWTHSRPYTGLLLSSSISLWTMKQLKTEVCVYLCIPLVWHRGWHIWVSSHMFVEWMSKWINGWYDHCIE